MTAPHPSSNAEFLSAIFGPLPPGARPRVCGFLGAPKAAAGAAWGGWPWDSSEVDGTPEANWYFTLATHRPDERGVHRRSRRQCVAVHGVLCDDIGTKGGPRDRLVLPPSFVVETSPGNFQAVYLFERPCLVIEDAEALQRSLIAAGMCDAGADGPSARYARLPFGSNGKTSPPFTCRVSEWRPQIRYSIEQIRQGLALPAAEPATLKKIDPLAVRAAWDARAPEEQLRVVADLRSALAAIPSDNRDLWQRVGHYLKASLPESLAFELWAEWSAKSDKWDADRGEDTFVSFDPDHCTHASVFHLAAQYGWLNPRHDPTAVGFGVGVQLPPSASSIPLPPIRTTTLAKDNPLNSAKAMVDTLYQGPGGYPAVRYWQSVFYRWAGAAWDEFPIDDLKADVYGFIDRLGGTFRPDQSNVAKIVDALKAEVNLTARHVPPCWIEQASGPPSLELLSVQNGLLHLPTAQLQPPNARLFTFNAVPCAYASNAPLPFQWHHFLRSLWPNDPEAIATLQEVFGYMLTGDTSQQKIFLIVGPKRSGKGTIARVLTELLGKRNVYGLSLSSLKETFGLQPLIGKLAAVVSDARLGGGADQQHVAENLLRISGEDAVGINRKNLPHVSLTLNCRFLLLTNELPRIADSSGALASRFIVLQMAESFYGKEDRGLTNRLLGELPGILNWALEGWKRLNARGHFVPPASSSEAADELADLASPIAAFVRERCTLAPSAEVTSEELYFAYRDWCSQQGFERIPAKSVFGRDLCAAFRGRVETTRGRRDAGTRAPTYRGVALVPGQGWTGMTSIAAKTFSK